MSKIQKFTITNATIIIDNATTLQFNRNKCDQIDAPYIFTLTYKCKDYVLLHELQGFTEPEVIEPKTQEEYLEGLMTMNNPYYMDYQHMLHEQITIKKDSADYFLEANDSFNGDIYPYRNEALKSFHLFKVDNASWSEVELDLKMLHKEGLVEWDYFGNGMI